MYKTILSSNESENELDKAIEAQEEDDSYDPMTPPLTPLTITADTIKEYDQEAFNEARPPTCILSSKPLVASIAAVLIIAFLYSNFRSLKSDLQSIQSRVEALEQENQILKTALDELEKKMRDPFSTAEEIVFSAAFNDEEVEERRNPPKTKRVWLGNEVEDMVQILDKNSLPDYCYFTDENDLFYEYNTEICEGKRRKLEAKKSRDNKDSKGKRKEEIVLDNIWKVERKSYDEQISNTLQSLNDEIHEIKRKREDAKPAEVVEVTAAVADQEEKREKSKNSERRKKKKLERQKQVGSSEWVDKRTSGREEARKKHEKQQPEINWFLKRKNERAAIRLESSGAERES